jgi:hypothetical protein
MQTSKALDPATDISGGRSGLGECGMFVLLHDLLPSHEISEKYIRMYRVSHGREKFMKLFSWFLKRITVWLKSATVVFALIAHSSPQNLLALRLIYQLAPNEAFSMPCHYPVFRGSAGRGSSVSLPQPASLPPRLSSNVGEVPLRAEAMDATKNALEPLRLRRASRCASRGKFGWALRRKCREETAQRGQRIGLVGSTSFALPSSV